MIEAWMKNHLVSDNNYNIANLYAQICYKERQKT